MDAFDNLVAKQFGRDLVLANVFRSFHQIFDDTRLSSAVKSFEVAAGKRNCELAAQEPPGSRCDLVRIDKLDVCEDESTTLIRVEAFPLFMLPTPGREELKSDAIQSDFDLESENE